MQVAGKGRIPEPNSAHVTIPLAPRYEVTNFPRNRGSFRNGGAASLRQRRAFIQQQNALTKAKLYNQLKYWKDRLTTFWKAYFPTTGTETKVSRALFVFNIVMAIQLYVNANAFGPVRNLGVNQFWVYVYMLGFFTSGLAHLAASMHWPGLSLTQTIVLRRSAYTSSISITVGWILLYILSGVQLGGLFGAVYPWFLILYFKLAAYKSSVPDSERSSKAKLRKEIRRDRG